MSATNCSDAWSVGEERPDRPEWQRCRQAWNELYMFQKTCLPHLPGGRKKFKRNLNTVLTRLRRRRNGGRRGLSDDHLRLRARRPGNKAIDGDRLMPGGSYGKVFVVRNCCLMLWKSSTRSCAARCVQRILENSRTLRRWKGT